MTRTEKWKDYRNKIAKITSSDIAKARKMMKNQYQEKKEEVCIDTFFQDLMKEINASVMFNGKD